MAKTMVTAKMRKRALKILSEELERVTMIVCQVTSAMGQVQEE